MIHIQRVDYHNTDHGTALVHILNEYAKDPMGGGQALAQQVQQQLVERLQHVPGAISLLAYDGEKPIGLLNAFTGFSTFAAKPLVNIHDLAVLKAYRGQGVAHRLLSECENIAKELGCCKLTLEVLAGNVSAKKSYQRFGFANYELDKACGGAEFWEKKL